MNNLKTKIRRCLFFVRKGAFGVLIYKLLYQFACMLSKEKFADEMLYRKHDAINSYMDFIWRTMGKQLPPPSCYQISMGILFGCFGGKGRILCPRWCRYVSNNY